MNIKKGDTVQIIKGKDKGKTGPVEKVLPEVSRLIVAGVNIRKHHLKKSASRPQGGIIDIPGQIHRSNVSLVCPNCSQQTKITAEVANNKRYRACGRCKANLDAK